MGIGAAFDSQVEVEKAANAQQVKDVAEEATLVTASQTMKDPQKRARPNPPMSVQNTPMASMEESKTERCHTPAANEHTHLRKSKGLQRAFDRVSSMAWCGISEYESSL